MRGSSKRIFGILATILCLVGSVFIYGYLVRPAMREIDELRGKLMFRTDVLENYGKAVKQLQALLSQYQESSDVQEQVSLALPLGQNVPQSVNQVVGIAAASNLEIKSLTVQQLAVKPSSVSLVKGIGILRMNVNLAGSYDNFKSFLKSLETNIAILDVVNLKIEIQKEKTGIPFLAYIMTIDTYYQTE